MVEHIWNKIDKFSTTDNPILLRLLSAPFWHIKGWRRFILVNVILATCFWIILGWDSTIDQIIPISLKTGSPAFLFSFIEYIQGKVPWSYVAEQTASCYGLGTHWGAVVIYGLFFILISKYYEKIGIKKSMNLMLSLCFTVLNISIFEFSWMFSYAIFQNQTWVIGPQHGAFLMNMMFFAGGIIGTTFALSSPYSFNFDKKALLLIALTIGAWLVWIYYPFSVQSLSVPISTGEVWSNTNNFPQTMYTIDMYPNDELRAGYPFHVQDHLVHSINVLAKVLMTVSMFYVVKLREKDKKIINIEKIYNM